MQGLRSGVPGCRKRNLPALLRAARARLRLGRRSPATATRERIEAGPRSLWRYEALLPAAAPRARGRRPGLDAARPGAAARARARDRRAAPEARPHEPDALVQGPRRRGRRRQGGGARRSTRSPARRPATSATRSRRAPPRAACARSSSTRRPSSPRSCSRRPSTAARCTPSRGSYDDCSRLVVELAGELDWAFVNVNLRLVLRRGLEDARVRARRAARVGAARRRRLARSRSGSLFTKLWQGFEQFARLGLVEGERPRIYGGQAEGCSPVADAFDGGPRAVSPVRPGDARALARDRRSRRRRPRDRNGACVGRRDLLGAGGRGRRQHVAARRDVRRLRRDRRRRRRSARCGRPRPRGEIGEGDRVVALITGTGLKTPQAVEVREGKRHRRDVDELLDGLGALATARAAERCDARAIRGLELAVSTPIHSSPHRLPARRRHRARGARPGRARARGAAARRRDRAAAVRRRRDRRDRRPAAAPRRSRPAARRAACCSAPSAARSGTAARCGPSRG